MLFLKYLDDLEQEQAMEAEFVGRPYEFLIDEPLRRSSWAAPKRPDGSFANLVKVLIWDYCGLNGIMIQE